MEVSTLKYHGGLGLHARSPLLRLQSDERLIAFVRRGNVTAFETLVGRYESRLLAFCRHLLGSREDAEDILQEVFAAAFNAILADDRPIKVRPWLYRIARNRSLNHLRRNQAVGVDSMDVHLSDNGASTADKAHDREEFRILVGDIHDLPETQRTALVLREMDALSYEQIADAMETTVPSVKSLLVRARVSLAEAAEARLLSCDQVRIELGEVAEGLRRRPSPLVRRHLRSCDRCSSFRVQLKETNKALAALLPIGPFVLLKKLALAHIGHSAGSGAAGSGASAAAGSGAAGSTAAAGSTTAAGATAAAGTTAAAGSTAAGSTAVAGSAFAATSGAGGIVTAGVGAVATKAVAGLAAAAIVTAGAVEVDTSSQRHIHHTASSLGSIAAIVKPGTKPAVTHGAAILAKAKAVKAKRQASASQQANKTLLAAAGTTPSKTSAKVAKPTTTTPVATPPPGRTVTRTDPTVALQPTSCPPGGVRTNGSSVLGAGGSAGPTVSCSSATTDTTTAPGSGTTTAANTGTSTTSTTSTTTDGTPTGTTPGGTTTTPVGTGTTPGGTGTTPGGTGTTPGDTGSAPGTSPQAGVTPLPVLHLKLRHRWAVHFKRTW
jgi:RNA polymerase sigma factor (sigma-70 family)